MFKELRGQSQNLEKNREDGVRVWEKDSGGLVSQNNGTGFHSEIECRFGF